MASLPAEFQLAWVLTALWQMRGSASVTMVRVGVSPHRSPWAVRSECQREAIAGLDRHDPVEGLTSVT